MAMTISMPSTDNTFNATAHGYAYVNWEYYTFPGTPAYWRVKLRVYAGTTLVYDQMSGQLHTPLYMNPGMSIGPFSATRSATFHVYADVYTTIVFAETVDLGEISGITETSLQPYSMIKLRSFSGWAEGASELGLDDPIMITEDVSLNQKYHVSLYADLAFQEFRDNPWIEHLAFDMINEAPEYGECLPSEYRYSINGATPTAWELIYWHHEGYMYPQNMFRFVIGKFTPKHWNTVRIDTRNVAGTFIGPTFKVLTAPTLVNPSYVEGSFDGNVPYIESVPAVPGSSETIIRSNFAENKVVVIKDNTDAYRRKKAFWR